MVTVFGFDRNGNFDSDFAGGDGFVYLDDYNELKCYIDHLESRLAELEKDAARYKWIMEYDDFEEVIEVLSLGSDDAIDRAMIRES